MNHSASEVVVAAFKKLHERLEYFESITGQQYGIGQVEGNLANMLAKDELFQALVEILAAGGFSL